MFIIPQFIPSAYFCSFHLSLPAVCHLQSLSQLQQGAVPLQLPFPDVVIASDASPNHWVIYFQVSGLPLSFSCICLVSICRAHIVLEELQTVALMLPRMTFLLI